MLIKEEETMRVLTVEDVKELIARAKAGPADPMAIATGLVGGLGESASVTGDVLRQGLKESGLPLPAGSDVVLGGVQSLEKAGDKVQLVLNAQLQPVVRGTQLRLGPTISAVVQKFPDGVALAEIVGVSVNKFVWIDIQRVQFHENAGKRSVRVDTNFGGKDFELP